MATGDRHFGTDLRGALANALLIAGEPEGERHGREALATTGARVMATLALKEVAARLDDYPAVDLILFEVRHAATDDLSGALDAVAARLATTMTRVVICFDADQIDLIAARLMSARVQLLCAPSHADRVAALAVALAGRGFAALRAPDRDPEPGRLQRLNEEIARIADMLTRLTREDDDPPPRDVLGDRNNPYRSEADEAMPVTAYEIRQSIRVRRLRDQFFGPGLFEDPAWDMLLDLFAAELERGRVSVSSLCIAAAVPPTTALRWISRMTDLGLLDREPDPFDRRRAYMILSPSARDGMRNYCAAVKRMGASIA